MEGHVFRHVHDASGRKFDDGVGRLCELTSGAYRPCS
jgi:hypothetical protein